MSSTDATSSGRQAARRQLVMMAGTLVLVLLLINVVALYGLDQIRREVEAYAAATDGLIEATDVAREAQVAFKTQVQEWKNVLLRGHDPSDLAAYRTAFRRQEATVAERVRQVRERAAAAGMPTQSAGDILAMHAELGCRYAEALAGFEAGTSEAAWRTDRAVRGMDRPLNDAFDAMVVEVRRTAEERRVGVAARLAEVNAEQRRILIAAHAAGMALVLVSLVLALRAIRRR